MKKLSSINSLILILEKSLMNLPTPSSISYLWNMGFLLGMTLTLQIITGLTLCMNYVSETSMAFDSVIHIMRDLEYGWYIRYIHMNGASFFFILMYTHISRGLYFDSPKKLPMVWNSGVIILLISMMTAFMGYVLPWGQMSFWGATVITSMLSAIPYLGENLTLWFWGNFSVSQPTLNRFMALHFILPLFIAFLVLVHIIFLHQSGSSNPLGLTTNFDKMKFFPLFFAKDFFSLMVMFMVLMLLLCMTPNILGDVENFNEAMPTVTPNHIQPEWYFLFAYAILRSIPSKLGGVLLMVMSILMLMTLSLKKPHMSKKFSPSKKLLFWVFINIVIMLSWIGSNPVEQPFIIIGMMLTVFYFTIMVML